jgi:hypothetical protein
MNNKEAQQLLNKIGEQLALIGKAGKMVFGDDSVAVNIDHDDGTKLFYTNALVLHKEEYWLIFTEHNLYHTFHEEDVQVSVYKRLYNDNSKLLEGIVGELGL